MVRSLTIFASTLLAGTLAHASLVKAPDSLVVFGSGLGAVDTLVTVHDPGGPGDNDGTEGGCISRSGGADSFACVLGTGVTENDNTALNNTVLFADIGYVAGQNIAAVVNIAETGQDLTVTLTGLYLTFYGANDAIIHTAIYQDGPINLTQGTGTGIGGSGFVFVLNDAEKAIVSAAAATNSILRIGGGVQFANGTTNNGNDTMYVATVACVGECEEEPGVPEPASMMLIGGGLVGLGLFRRFRK